MITDSETRLGAFEDALAAMRTDLHQAEETLADLRAQNKCKTATYQQLFSQKLMLQRALGYFDSRGL